MPRVLARIRTGGGPAIGPHTGELFWPLLAGVWRAIAPLMQPWCAEGEVPTAANLNLFRGWRSCVGWHCDDEPPFGECGDAKLIVSVSYGSSAVFRWRRQSCSDNEGHLCWLGHGDVLVMDGQCQDEFLHCTDPGLEQERINVTFRWVRQRAASCPLFRTGVACCLPTCAQGSSGPVMGNVGSGVFWAFWLLFSVLCRWRVLALLVDPLLCTRLGSRWCASCWTRPLVGGRWEHCLCDLWEDCLAAHKPAKYFSGTKDSFMRGKPYMLALVGQPVSMVIMHMWFIGIKGALREIAGKSMVRSLFLLVGSFCLLRIRGYGSGGLILWHLWIGRARHPGPASNSQHVGLEVFNVGEWLTRGDLALEAQVDFLAVVEHRLLLARVRNEWARLKRKGLASIRAPACQVSSHVGNAGVGVIGMRGAPLALPTFATAQFKRFFDCGPTIRCMLPLGAGRFMHLVVLYGYQGVDTDAEQLALTEQLFDAALGELGVVARGQPCLLVGDFNVEPTKIPCLSKGISAGLWVDFEASWAFASGMQPTPTCKLLVVVTGGTSR